MRDPAGIRTAVQRVLILVAFAEPTFHYYSGLNERTGDLTGQSLPIFIQVVWSFVFQRGFW